MPIPKCSSGPTSVNGSSSASWTVLSLEAKWYRREMLSDDATRLVKNSTYLEPHVRNDDDQTDLYALCHILEALSIIGEIWMMRQQVKKPDKN